MNLNQIALLLDNEISEIEKDISKLGAMLKDQTVLDPSPNKLLSLHLAIGEIVANLSPLAEEMLFHIKPQYKDFLSAMKTIFLVHVDAEKKKLADALSTIRAAREIEGE